LRTASSLKDGLYDLDSLCSHQKSETTTSLTLGVVEHEPGGKLFDRSQRGSTLTQSDQALLTEAQRVLLAYDELKRTASALVHDYQHTVRVGLAGMAIGLAHPDLARWLGRAREELLDIDLQVLECDDGALVRALRDGTLDVGVALGAVAYDDLVVHPIWRDPIQVVMPAGHALTRYVDVTLADVHAYPLIVCHPQSDASASAGQHAWLDSHPDQPVIGQYASSIPSMLTLVAVGFGVSFIAQSQARRWRVKMCALCPWSNRWQFSRRMRCIGPARCARSISGSSP
jgi:DNA-binding transcriptional LysR family regulator